MDAHTFARAWIDSWNSHDLETILSHYADDIEISTPMIKLATGGKTNSLVGKEAVKDYWKKALERIPDLYFELFDVTEGVNSVALYYQSIMNKKPIDSALGNLLKEVDDQRPYYFECVNHLQKISSPPFVNCDSLAAKMQVIFLGVREIARS